MHRQEKGINRGVRHSLIERIQKRKTRMYLHGIVIAFLPLLVGYGIMTDETFLLWAGVAGAILIPGIRIAEEAVDMKDETRQRDHERGVQREKDTGHELHDTTKTDKE